MKNRKTNSPIFLIIILLTLCQRVNSQKILDYDINIRYSQMKEIIDSRFSQQLEAKYQDSVLLFFEGGFSNHNVTIKVNGKAYASENITSNEVLDFAKEYNVGKVNDVHYVEITLERGPSIYIQPDSIRKLISLNYFDNVVTVEFMNNHPYYD